MFWKALKDQVRRGELTDAGTLSSRVIEGSERCSCWTHTNFIRHSADVFPKCLNKEHL
ncbi:hypothetical protein BCV71DRAFT_273314 [Rhizopus microsporus]|uniref:Uncharacterized protein n=1 Tax=Rhizopus microsporus TaxID=58291 RepID=A0A1X0RUV5_RHIZD|nr:hypothetical protein BCV71DRAFT_273314 [Rhizopus microsporus]